MNILPNLEIIITRRAKPILVLPGDTPGAAAPDIDPVPFHSCLLHEKTSCRQ